MIKLAQPTLASEDIDAAGFAAGGKGGIVGAESGDVEEPAGAGQGELPPIRRVEDLGGIEMLVSLGRS